MDLTTNYQFKKATYSDPASIIDFMSNFDTIDTLLKSINDTLPNKAEHTNYVTNADLNTLLDDKSYICAGTLKNTPVANTYCFLRCYDTGSTNKILQVCTVPQTDNTARMFNRVVIAGSAGTASTVGAWRELVTDKTLSDTVDTLKTLIHENTFRNTALGDAMTKDLTTLVIQTFSDISAVDNTKGDGATAIANYYKADKHIFDKNDTGTAVIYSIAKTVTSGNNNAWALADWEDVASGSVEIAISRNNGTTFTVIPNNTLTRISSQTAGVSVIVRVTMTGKLRLKNIAWGLKA